MTGSPAPLLDVRGLSKSFGALRAVDDVSFTVSDGEILGIAGPNGAGKTTLFNLISGIPFSADRGEITFDGRRIDGMPAHLRFRAGLARTFQKETSFAKLTVQQNVRLAGSFGGRLGPRALDRAVEETLQRFGLGDMEDMLADSLTVFDSKLLMIATAVVGAPRLLLLDEPASGLNSIEQQELQKLILDLKDEGMAIILIEHILPLLFGVSKRVLVMDFGSKLTEGAPAEISSDPKVIEAYLGGQDSDRHLSRNQHA